MDAKLEIISRLRKMEKELDNEECRELIKYLDKKTRKYDFKTWKNINPPHSHCSSNFFPFEIVKAIFDNIPSQERNIHFFETNKYYNNFSHICYNNYPCDLSKKFNVISSRIFDELQTNNIRILKNVYDINIIKHFPNLISLSFEKKPASYTPTKLVSCTPKQFEFPEGLQILEFNSSVLPSCINNFLLPDSLKELIFNIHVSNTSTSINFKLPPNLEVLYMPSFVFSDKMHFPKSLKILVCSRFTKIEGVIFPPKLETFELHMYDKYGMFNYMFEDIVFPDSVTKLRCGLNGLRLPKSKKLTLDLRGLYKPSFDDIIFPDSIEQLILHFEYQYISFDNLKLNNSLKYLILGGDFNQSLIDLKLPDGIRELHVGQHFEGTIDCLKIPNSLEKITKYNDYEGHSRTTLYEK